MAIESVASIKSNFQTGDRPTQADFVNFIDTAIPDWQVAITSGVQAGATGLLEIESTAAATTRSTGALGLVLLAAGTTASAQGALGGGTAGIAIYGAATTASAQNAIGAGTAVGGLVQFGNDGSGNAQYPAADGSLITKVTLPRSYLSGLSLSNDVTDADHDIVISAGECRDAANAANIVLSVITKRLDATWVAGTGNGGLASSLTAPANNTWYHVFAIIVGGAADVGFDTDVDAANLITDHSATAYRRLGSVLTDGSANILAFSQNGDEFLWNVVVEDLELSNPGTTAALRTLTVPTGVKVDALMNVGGINGTNVFGVYMSSPDVSDQAAHDPTTAAAASPGATLAVRETTTPRWNFVQARVRTNTSAQVRSRQSNSGASDVFAIMTLGWIDRRGRDD